jgi:hypothetical protein
MKLLDRYIFRQFTTTFVMLVLGLPLLFTITDVTDRLDRYLARGDPRWDRWRSPTSTRSRSSSSGRCRSRR